MVRFGPLCGLLVPVWGRFERHCGHIPIRAGRADQDQIVNLHPSWSEGTWRLYVLRRSVLEKCFKIGGPETSSGAGDRTGESPAGGPASQPNAVSRRVRGL